MSVLYETAVGWNKSNLQACIWSCVYRNGCSLVSWQGVYTVLILQPVGLKLFKYTGTSIFSKSQILYEFQTENSVVPLNFCEFAFMLRIRCIEVMFVHVWDLESVWLKYLLSSNRYKSNEDYVYVRGRGRGKYICEECGIRCKKPSMLKKHIRTHTDVRPYVCKLCNFAFKTKGTRPFLLNSCHFWSYFALWVPITHCYQGEYFLQNNTVVFIYTGLYNRVCSLLFNWSRDFERLWNSLDSFIKTYKLLAGPSVCRENVVA